MNCCFFCISCQELFKNLSKNILGKVPLTKSIKGLDWKKKLKLCFSWISDNPLSKNQNKLFIELLLKCVGCFRLYNEIKKGFLPKSSYNVINRPTFITKPFLLPKISRNFFPDAWPVDDVMNFWIYLQRFSPGMVDRERRRGQRNTKIKDL